MTRYFFHIAYQGTHFRGWQWQSNVSSVQELIELRLAQAIKLEKITIIGCGRTDAGVHANQYFFHADIKTIPDDLKHRLNKLLPKSIVIYEIIPIKEKIHARFDATLRQYDFFAHTSKDPFLFGLSSLFETKKLNLEKMKKAVEIIGMQENFRAFCKSPDKHNTTICRIYSVKLFIDKSGKKIRFQITANRFLKGMIRILMQKILEIGSGTFTLEAFDNCFASNTAAKKTKSALPDGLYLSKVEYSSLKREPMPVSPLFEIEWLEI